MAYGSSSENRYVIESIFDGFLSRLAGETLFYFNRISNIDILTVLLECIYRKASLYRYVVIEAKLIVQQMTRSWRVDIRGSCLLVMCLTICSL